MWKATMLSPEVRARLGEDSSGRGLSMGLGWFVHDDDRLIHHGGGTEGYSSQLDLYRQQRRAVIVLCNNELATAADLAWRINEALAGP